MTYYFIHGFMSDKKYGKSLMIIMLTLMLFGGLGYAFNRVNPSSDPVETEVVAMAPERTRQDLGEEANSIGKIAGDRESAWQTLGQFIAKRYRVSPNTIAQIVVIAREEGRRISVDPLLILAVIGIESSYNASAESSAGALGLMQVMPHIHEPDYPYAQGKLTEIKINIQVGSQILGRYIRQSSALDQALLRYVGSEPGSLYPQKIREEFLLLHGIFFVNGSSV